MADITIPTDYAFSTWTLSNLDDNTTSISLTSGQDSGTATSPVTGYDATSDYQFMLPSWTLDYGYGLSFEARTATTAAGISSASWFGIRNDCMIPLSKRYRFIQVKATFARNSDDTSPILYTLTLNYYTAQVKTDTAGFNYSMSGSQPTKDGKFEGRIYQCAISAKTIRRNEGIRQRGKLVSRKLAWDRSRDIYLGYEPAKEWRR